MGYLRFIGDPVPILTSEQTADRAETHSMAVIECRL